MILYMLIIQYILLGFKAVIVVTFIFHLVEKTIFVFEFKIIVNGSLSSKQSIIHRTRVFDLFIAQLNANIIDSIVMFLCKIIE